MVNIQYCSPFQLTLNLIRVYLFRNSRDFLQTNYSTRRSACTRRYLTRRSLLTGTSISLSSRVCATAEYTLCTHIFFRSIFLRCVNTCTVCHPQNAFTRTRLVSPNVKSTCSNFAPGCASSHESKESQSLDASAAPRRTAQWCRFKYSRDRDMAVRMWVPHTHTHHMSVVARAISRSLLCEWRRDARLTLCADSRSCVWYIWRKMPLTVWRQHTIRLLHTHTHTHARTHTHLIFSWSIGFADKLNRAHVISFLFFRLARDARAHAFFTTQHPPPLRNPPWQQDMWGGLLSALERRNDVSHIDGVCLFARRGTRVCATRSRTQKRGRASLSVGVGKVSVQPTACKLVSHNVIAPCDDGSGRV